MNDSIAREEVLIAEAVGWLLATSPEPVSTAISEIDWSYVIQRGEEHLILPLVRHYTDLRGLTEKIPVAAREELIAAYRGALVQHLAATAWLRRFLAETHSSGIGVILLKGALLAEELYPDPALRQFTDIDLLVATTHVRNCASILEKLGLEIEPGSNLEELVRIYNHATYRPTKGAESRCPLPVELHWGFHERESPVRFDSSMVWADARRIELGGLSIDTLSYEDEIIFGAHHLCTHVFFNSTPALRWLLDLALRVTRFRDAINWNLLVDRSQHYKAWPACAAAFILLSRVLNVELPEWIMAAARKQTNGAFASLLEHMSFVDLLEERLASNPRGRFVAQLGLNPGLRAKGALAASRMRSNLTSVLRLWRAHT